MAISLANKMRDGTLWSIEQMLCELIDDKERLEGYNKALVTAFE